MDTKQMARNAAAKVLRNPERSKKACMARGSALSSPWQSIRRKPYTEIGISRLSCIRCGEHASYQWQICSDNNNYRPICTECDIKLNRLVLKFMRHPHFGQLADEYAEKKRED